MIPGYLTPLLERLVLAARGRGHHGDLYPENLHLSDDQIGFYVDAMLSPEKKILVSEHVICTLLHCRECALRFQAAIQAREWPITIVADELRLRSIVVDGSTYDALGDSKVLAASRQQGDNILRLVARQDNQDSGALILSLYFCTKDYGAMPGSVVQLDGYDLGGSSYRDTQRTDGMGAVSFGPLPSGCYTLRPPTEPVLYIPVKVQVNQEW